jgi:hypothetical protein
MEGCEFIYYLAEENIWADWGMNWESAAVTKCLRITHSLRRRVGPIPSVRRRRRPLDRGRDALFIRIASELLRIRIASRQALTT